MSGPSTRPERAPLKYRDQTDDGVEREDAAFSCESDLGVPPEEDAGNDPYNHTGRFERTFR